MRPYKSRHEWPLPAAELVCPDIFTADECATILSKFGSKTDAGGIVIPSDESRAHWIHQKLDPVVTKWNAQGFSFEVETCADMILVYRGAGHVEDWHADLGAGPAARRKLSFVLALSPAESYSGGSLEFTRDGGERTSHRLEAGSVAIFPSWLMHRVSAITEGSLWSLAGWFLGPPFR